MSDLTFYKIDCEHDHYRLRELTNYAYKTNEAAVAAVLAWLAVPENLNSVEPYPDNYGYGFETKLGEPSIKYEAHSVTISWNVYKRMRSRVGEKTTTVEVDGKSYTRTEKVELDPAGEWELVTKDVWKFFRSVCEPVTVETYLSIEDHVIQWAPEPAETGGCDVSRA